MKLQFQPTQSASSSKSAKGSRSPRKIENKMTEAKVNLIQINPYLQLIDSYHFARFHHRSLEREFFRN